jgi:Ni,Fe-hydrogenase III large subunit
MAPYGEVGVAVRVTDAVVLNSVSAQPCLSCEDLMMADERTRLGLVALWRLLV